jgi:hypothetical protein
MNRNLVSTALAPGDRLRARIILPNGDELSAIFSYR